MTVQTYVYPICFRGGLFGWALTWLALSMGQGLWLGYAFLAFYLGELYFVMGASAGLVTVVIQFIFGTLYAPHMPSPFDPLSSTLCAGGYTGLLPSLAIAMLAEFWVICVLHDLHLHMRTSWLAHLKRLLILIVVPIIVVWSYNATYLNALYGALLGLAIGQIVGSLLLLVWLPRFMDVARFFHSLNLTHRPDLLARHDRDHPQNPKAINLTFF